MGIAGLVFVHGLLLFGGCFEVFGGWFVVLSIVDLVFVNHQVPVCLFMFYCHMVWFTFACRML